MYVFRIYHACRILEFEIRWYVMNGFQLDWYTRIWIFNLIKISVFEFDIPLLGYYTIMMSYLVS